MAKKKLTKEQKKMTHATAVAGNGAKANPYLPTDYNVGMRNPKREVKPMKEKVDVMSVKQWVGTIIVLMIPLVNIIALIAWIKKDNEKVNANKRNFAKGYLIAWLISLVVAFVLVALIVVVIMIMPLEISTEPLDAVSGLQAEEYDIVLTDGADLHYDDIETSIAARLTLDDGTSEFVNIYYFKDESSAQSFYDANELNWEYDEYSFGIVENVVYYGTEAGVEAAKSSAF